MNRTIIIAGAGHGGLSAAINLAKNNFDVTIFEKMPEEDLGHDWYDFISMHTFDCIPLDMPDVNIEKFYSTAFHNPGKDIKIINRCNPEHPNITMDRKEILKHLIKSAKNAGVKFIFNCEVKKAICKNDVVKGLVIIKDGIEETVYADLVIDAAGMNSPVRKSLPKYYRINHNFKSNETFTAYRAIFERKDDYTTDPEYSIFFYHNNRCGMDWVITQKDDIDVLIGSFGDLTQKEIDESLEDFKQSYSCIGDKILRGGYVAQIPIRRALPKFVYNGYAAIGDCVSMVEPLCGSGITMSFIAGKILADVIIKNSDKEYTKYVLWEYNYRYFTELGNSKISDDITKNFMIFAGAKKLDYMFRTRILSEHELCGGGKYSIAQITEKALALVKNHSVVPNITKLLKGYKKVDSVTAFLPKEYDEAKIHKWINKYESL